MEKEILRCAIYIRVSTAEQAMHGKSLSAQTKYLTDYAADRNMDVIGVFADEGKTARKNFKDRKAIKELLEHVKRGEVDVILFWKMDRWFRNVADFYKVQDILDAHKVRWIAVAEPNMNMDTREGRLNLNIMLSINQNETDTTSERIRFVNEASIKQGRVISGAQPIGYKIQEDGGVKRIVKDPEREWLVNEFFEYYLIHQSKRSALLYLNGKYGPVITSRQIDTLCYNPMYSGYYRGNPDYCPPYITLEQYSLLCDIRRRNVKLYASQERERSAYLFAGLVTCPLCGRTMGASSASRDSKSGGARKVPYRYYRCQNRIYDNTCDFKKSVNETSVENCLIAYTDQEFSDIGIKMQIVRRAPFSGESHIKTESLEKEMARLNVMFQKGRMSEESYDLEYERLEALIERQAKQTQGPPGGEIHSEIEGEPPKLEEDGWRAIYERLSRQNKRAFWRSFVKEIKINKDNGLVETIVLL